ncbi:hypothetical protein BS78_06G044600 [Paspalum vaginatum]|nr:hypothetical protein BS78_06G044600 [Paspalum vaginatum]
MRMWSLTLRHRRTTVHRRRRILPRRRNTRRSSTAKMEEDCDPIQTEEEGNMQFTGCDALGISNALH